MYNVIDIQTGKAIKAFPTLKRASSYANRKDLEYGAVRYIVKLCLTGTGE